MAHIHEKIDFTASVYVVEGDRVLLHKHKKLGIWLPPGGHVELDEDPNQAAIKEVREETGLDITLVGNNHMAKTWSDGSRDLITPKFINRHYFDSTHTHEHIDSVYFGRVSGGALRPEVEGAEVKWFSKSEIEDGTLNLKEAVLFYALAALKELAE